MAKILGMDGKGNFDPNKGSQNPQLNPQNVTLDKTKPIVCKECGGDVFFPGVKFRTVSRLLTGQPKDALVPIEVYTCGGCGTILEDLLQK